MPTLRTPISEFPLAAPFNLDIFKFQVSQLALAVQPIISRITIPVETAVSVWTAMAPADYTLYFGVVQTHVGGNTNSDPELFENLGNVDTVSGAGPSAFVAVFDVTITAKNGGLYEFTLLSSLLMPAIVANTAVYGRVLLGGGSGVLVAETTGVSATQPLGFTPSGSIRLNPGQSMQIRYQIQKQGTPAAIARANNSRLTFCRIAD